MQGHLQDVSPLDQDYFHLVQTSGTLNLSVLPDWGLLDFGMGPQLAQETQVSATLQQVVKVYANELLIDEFLSLVSFAQELTDQILLAQYGNSVFGSPPTFLNFDLTLPTQTSTIDPSTQWTYVYTADFYLVVSGNPQTFGDLYVVTDAYAVVTGNPTGVRAALWGSDWVNLLSCRTAGND